MGQGRIKETKLMATITDKYILEVDTRGGIAGMNAAGVASGGLASKLRGIGPLAIAAAGALAGFAAITGIKNVVDDMDDLAKAARNVGITSNEGFESFQVISNTLGEMGLTSNETDRALRNLTTRMQKAADTGKGPAAAAFEKLGSAVLDANGNLLDAPALFEAVTSAIQDGTLNVVDAQAAFGEMVGPKILGGFQDLADKGMSVSDALADVAENSNIVSLDAAKNAEAFNDTLGRLTEVASQLGTGIATALLPILNQMAEGALAILPGLIDGVKAGFSALSPIIDALIPIGQALFTLLEALWPVFETLLGLLGPVAEIIGGALTLAIQGVTTVIETVIRVIEGFVGKIREISAAVSEVAGAVGQKWDGMTEGMANGARNAADKVTGFFGGMYDTVVGNSIIPDMAKEVLGEFAFMGAGMEDSVASSANNVTRSFSGVAATISNEFENLTGISLNSINSQVGSLSNALGGKISQLTDSLGSSFGGLGGVIGNVAGAVFGGGGGLLGDVFGGLSKGIGDLFGGFFADGGFLPAGKFGVVGERGPELITGPANITPMDQMGGGQQVIYNINAVDARSFRDMLAREPGMIHALAQKGGSRVPGRF